MPNEINPLAMSDEDFLKDGIPPPSTKVEGDGENTGDDPNKDDGSGENNDGEGGDTNPDLNPNADNGDDGNANNEGDDDPSGKDDGDSGNLPAKDKSEEQDPSGKKPAGTKTPESKSQDEKDKDKSGEGGDGSQKDDKDPSGSKADDEKGTPDYKAFYERIMAPLKANGKTIDLRNPEEAIQLMQMGANYTRKMQAIAPHRKVLLMLENNGLLDEGKLSFLIDIEKKNPEAIKKLIKDAGIDPREIDLEDPDAKPYLVGNHRVTDEEASFRAVLDDLGSNPEGKATLQAIQAQWDQASKEVLWKQPEVMTLIHQQRENGIYDRISAEMERRRTLGMIPPNVPFLPAYKAIGD